MAELMPHHCTPAARSVASPRQVLAVTVVFLLVSSPAVFWASSLDHAAALWPMLGPARQAGIGLPPLETWVAVPLLIFSAVVLFLAPGILLALAACRGRSPTVLLLSAVPLAICTAIGVVEILRVLAPGQYGGPLPGCLMLGAVGLAGAGVAWLARRRSLLWPDMDRADLRGLGVTGAAMLLIVLVLLPKTLWENLNGDGAQAFEVTRLLMRHSLPFFPRSAGTLSSFPDWASLLFAYPGAWFMRLFGPVDAVVRLPFFICLPMVAVGVQALVEEHRRPMKARVVLAMWLGLGAYTLAMAYSASYSPYHADLAMPAPRETLLLACYLGFVHAMVRREWGWVAGFGVLTYAALPSGLLLMGLWLVAELLVTRPVPTGVVIRGAVVLACCVVTASLLTLLLRVSHQPLPGSELGYTRALRQLGRLTFTDWHRLVYALVGGGIFPLLTLAAWRRQDQVSRRVTVVVLVYLLYPLVQPRFNIHHLVPVMVLPAIVAARGCSLDAAPCRRWLGAWWVAGIVAIVLSLPRTLEVGMASRQVGMTVTQRVGNYEASDPEVFRASELLRQLFPSVWDPRVPDRQYGGSPVAWLRYAVSDTIVPGTNFLLSRVGDSMPPPWRVVASDDDFVLRVRSDRVWATLRHLNPPRTEAEIYRISKATLFGVDQPSTVHLDQVARHLARLLGWRRHDGGQP